MLRGIERWILYICFTIPIVVFTVLILIQRRYSLQYNSAQGAYGGHPEQVLLMNELFLKTFFLIFFCFLLILFGCLIVAREADRVFRHARDQKLSKTILSSMPGFAMLGIGCFLLFFSVFRPPVMSFLPDLAGPLKIITTKPEQNADVETSKADRSAETLSPPANSAKDHELPEKPKPNPDAAVANIPPADPVQQGPEVSADDLSWARQLETNAIKFGYSPTTSDNKRYSEIMSRQSREGRSVNTDAHWAFGLLQKMQKDYQPTPEELSRYEKIISGDLTRN